jgi:hypothetical protein
MEIIIFTAIGVVCLSLFVFWGIAKIQHGIKKQEAGEHFSGMLQEKRIFELKNELEKEKKFSEDILTTIRELRVENNQLKTAFAEKRKYPLKTFTKEDMILFGQMVYGLDKECIGRKFGIEELFDMFYNKDTNKTFSKISIYKKMHEVDKKILKNEINDLRELVDKLIRR